MSTRSHLDYELDDDPARLDFARVHAWLASSYWTPGIAREKVERGFAGSSLVIGAYLGPMQVGVARVISDRTSFAWICDVFVDSAHRGRRIGQAMLKMAIEDPNHQGLRRWVLATKDAHGVYEKLGFVTIPVPERWMWMLPPGSKG